MIPRPPAAIWLLPLLAAGCGAPRGAATPTPAVPGGTSGTAAAPAPAAPVAPAPEDTDVIATFDGGAIRVEDVDRHVMALPRESRMPPDGGSTAAWLAEAVSNVFIAKVVESSTEEPPEAVRRSLEAAERRAQASEGARRSVPRVEVSPEDIARRFEEVRDGLQSEEKRELSNILVPFPAGASPADRERVRRQVEGLRQQVAAGASFEALAREHSTSSSAAAGGSVGIVTRKMLRPEIADVVFALPPGVPSEVVTGAAGCQLFLVRQVYPAMKATLASVAASIEGSIIRERQAAHLGKRIAAEVEAQGAKLLPWPARGYPEGLADDSVVLEVDGHRVLGRDVRRAAGAGEPREAYDRLVADELLSRALRRDDPEGAEAVARAERERGTRAWRHRRELQRYLESIPVTELERYYQDHRARFMSDPEVELTVLAWPIEGDPLEAIVGPRAVAEKLRAARDPAKVIEEAMATAERTVIPLGSVRALAQAHPEISAQLLADHRQGSVFGPYRAGRRLLVIRVDTLVPARQLAFAEARERVLAAFAEDRHVDVEARFREAIAARHHLVVHRERLEGFGERLLDGLLEGTLAPAPGGS